MSSTDQLGEIFEKYNQACSDAWQMYIEGGDYDDESFEQYDKALDEAKLIATQALTEWKNQAIDNKLAELAQVPTQETINALTKAYNRVKKRESRKRKEEQQNDQ